MYNTCLWTLTKKNTNKIDAIQRKLLRKALNIKWPTIISNENLVKITEQEPWSKIIQRQRIRWFGHVLRLPENTPCKEALNEVKRTVPKTERPSNINMV